MLQLMNLMWDFSVVLHDIDNVDDDYDSWQWCLIFSLFFLFYLYSFALFFLSSPFYTIFHCCFYRNYEWSETIFQTSEENVWLRRDENLKLSTQNIAIHTYDWHNNNKHVATRKNLWTKVMRIKRLEQRIEQ